MDKLSSLRSLRLCVHPTIGKDEMLSERDKKLQSLGYPLDRVPGVGAIYKPVVIDGTTVYTSGNVPFDGDKLVGVGKVPTRVSLEVGKKHAALCAANILRHVI